MLLVLHEGALLQRRITPRMQATVRLARPIDDDELRDVAAQNPGWVVERVGGAIVMAPTSSEGARRNAKLTALLVMWAEARGYVAFDSNGGFTLHNGDVLAPDAAVVERSKWERLDMQTRDSFSPIAPDAIIELISRTDRKRDVESKCVAWFEAGVSYVVLLDPYEKTVRTWGDAPNGFPDDWSSVLA